KEILFHPVGIALQGQCPVLQMGDDESGDPAVVFQDLGLGETVGGIELLFQIRQRESPTGDFDDPAAHCPCLTLRMISSSAAIRSAGPSPSSAAAWGASTGGVSRAFRFRSSSTLSRRRSAYFSGLNSVIMSLMLLIMRLFSAASITASPGVISPSG